MAYDDYLNKYNKYTKTELLTEYKKLSVIANKRLRLLEDKRLTRSSNAYNWVERRVYDNRSKLFTTDTKGRVKFTTKYKNLSFHELKSYVATVDQFLKAKTSTSTGVAKTYGRTYKTYIEKNIIPSLKERGLDTTEIEKKLANAKPKDLLNFEKYLKKFEMNEKYGILSFDDYSEFWKSGLMQNYSKIYGSAEAVKLTQIMASENISASQMEDILRQGGFSENTQENEIPFSEISSNFENILDIAWEDL